MCNVKVPPVQTALVRALDELQAPVLQRRILQRYPETDCRLRLRGQERRVLVRAHLAAHAGILVNVHALRHRRPPEAQLPAHLLDALAARYPLEQLVLDVQRMADLVQGQLGGHEQCAVGGHGARLEEVAHLVARLAEVGVAVLGARVRRGGGSEGGAIGLRCVDGHLAAGGQQFAALGGSEEVIDDDVADLVQL